MERRGRKRRPRLMARWAARIRSAAQRCVTLMKAGWSATVHRLRPWKPVVIVDAKHGRARRLRRALVRATRAQFKALGVAPPEHLLVVVQRVVLSDRPVASLLQVFDGRDGRRRHVLYLAFVVGDDSMSDGAIVSTLRQQLYEGLGCELAERGWRTSSPLSPGEGVWSIREQRTIFGLLEPDEIGVRLLPSYVIDPVKSLTVVFGAGASPMGVEGMTNCDFCSIQDRCRYAGARVAH